MNKYMLVLLLAAPGAAYAMEEGETSDTPTVFKKEEEKRERNEADVELKEHLEEIKERVAFIKQWNIVENQLDENQRGKFSDNKVNLVNTTNMLINIYYEKKYAEEDKELGRLDKIIQFHGWRSL